MIELLAMTVKIWPLIGIIVLIGALIWANRVLPTGAAKPWIYVLLVLLGVCLILWSLGIFPEGAGIDVSGN